VAPEITHAAWGLLVVGSVYTGIMRKRLIILLLGLALGFAARYLYPPKGASESGQRRDEQGASQQP
jgi:hypothetical protein